MRTILSIELFKIRTSHSTRRQCQWTLVPNVGLLERFIGNRVYLFYFIFCHKGKQKGDDTSEPLKKSYSETDGNSREALAAEH